MVAVAASAGFATSGTIRRMPIAKVSARRALRKDDIMDVLC
jgi:hypothetical protein